MKTCTKCQEQKEYADFYKNKRTKDGYHHWCKSCIGARYAERYKNNRRPESPEKLRERALRYFYGISAEQFDSILDEQGGTCKVCPRVAAESTRKFAVDHDHSCCPGTKSCGKCVRGILCGNCNTALGLVNDSIETLQRMQVYLEKLL